MNHALLNELQGLSAYPSVTLLHSTQPAASMQASDVARLRALIAEADQRLSVEVDDEIRSHVTGALRRLVDAAATQRSSQAIAVCASPDHEAVIRLGRDVRTRVVVDRTFATRDMVADANRTATFRTVTVSEQLARLLVGDRHRLVEIDDRRWPLRRGEEERIELWRSRLGEAVASELRSFEVPTVLGGVAHTIGSLLDLDAVAPIGNLPGNHDTTAPGTLHAAAWPIVHDWLERDHVQALARLEHARGARVFAGGIDEIWDLAGDGRVELLVVEDDYHLAARVGGHHLAPESATTADTIDDVVDELIEIVLRSGGETVMVPPGELAEHDRIAAVLRY